MRSNHRADQVVARIDRRHPIAKGLADRVLERARAGRHGAHFGAEQAHTVDVHRLTLHVLFAHVDDALLVEHGAHRGRGHPVLARARLGDDAPLAHALRQQPLADRVVDLVRARVRQVFAFEPDRTCADPRGEPRRLMERRGTPDVRLEQAAKLGLECLVSHGGTKAGLQLLEGGHDRLGYVLPAVRTEAAASRRRGASWSVDHSRGLPPEKLG